MKSKKLLIVFSIIIALSMILAACGGGQQSSETQSNEEPQKQDEAKEEPQVEQVQKAYTVGLSNGYIGNNWRTQMIEAAEKLAEYYKGQGILEELIVQNAGLDVNNQIAHIRNMINSNVDFLLIDPNSETALNPVIEEANSKGIPVIAFDQPVTSEYAINVVIDQVKWGEVLADWLCNEIGGKGDIVLVTGLAGHPANVNRLRGMNAVLENFPDINILSEVNGNWDQANAQQVTSNLLTSYPNIDGVLTQDGMALGVVKAFMAADKELPVVTGETMMGFMREWKELKEAEGFSTIAQNNPPAISATALGMAVRILQGKEFADGALDGNNYYYPVKYVITNDDFDEVYEQFKDKPDSYFIDEHLTEEELDALFK